MRVLRMVASATTPKMIARQLKTSHLRFDQNTEIFAQRESWPGKVA